MAEKTKIKLGDVIMDAVVEENPDRTAEVTDKPVESGQDISDHMKIKPTVLKLSGSIVDDAAAKLEILKKYQKEATLLKYIGRNIIENLVLTSLNTKHNADNAKGFDYGLTLQQVRIAIPETFEVKVKDPESKNENQNEKQSKSKKAKTTSKVKKKTNSGRKQVQTSKGDDFPTQNVKNYKITSSYNDYLNNYFSKNNSKTRAKGGGNI